MFAINTSLLTLAILYSFVWLKWRTSSQQQPLVGTNWLLDFFDVRHVTTTVRTLVKSRLHHGKLHLWFLLLAMCLYTFQRDENPKSQMYTSLIFKWNVTDFSNFKTFKSTLFVVGQFNWTKLKLVIDSSQMLDNVQSQFVFWHEWKDKFRIEFENFHSRPI